ncbi:hypothetical protein GUJ93_ZPchr0229g18742 [Zizania palustris]|uniref:Uncharacterized protein n=1 Tax=Zizania palustris TaxID=103762 RepID=A0A8J5V054_ZIZPA|nr:hypothetical protein GUJ93_ZPchr0229g18742 [Zizania palustris]
MSRRRLSSIFASSSSSASSTASTSAPANLGRSGPDDARHLFDEVLLDCDLAKAPNQLLSALAPRASVRRQQRWPRLRHRAFQTDGPMCLSPGCSQRLHLQHSHRLLPPRAPPDLGLAIFGRLLKTGFGLNVVAYSTVIDSFFKEGEVDKAYDIFCEMKKQGISPNVVTYNSTIDGLCKSKAMDKAYDLFREMKKQGISPNVVTYNSTIDGLCKSKAMDKAYDLFREMKKQGISPNVVTYNSTIDGLCKSKKWTRLRSLGMWKESVRTFKDMSNCGLTPCVISCNSFMHALCKRGRIKEAKDIFDSMVKNGPKPNVACYSVLLHGYATQGCFADVGNMFNLMESNGITPDHHVFNILINAFARRGMMDKAILIFEDMRKKGVNPNGHCIHGYLVKANELISEMMNKGIPPPCIKFFNSIINNLCKEGRVAKVGDMKEALRIVDVMTSVGVEPDAGRTNTAKKIFNEMIDCGMTVSNATYNIVLGGLCRNNCTDEAIMLLDKLFAMNIKNDVVIFTTMISAMFKVGRREEAKKLFAAISTYGLVPDMYTDEAIMLLDKLFAMNIKNDVVVFTTMISAMFKVGRREEAKKLFAAISTYGLVPDMYTYGVMINNLIKEDSFEEADNIFSSMEKSGCAPDSRLLNGIIRTLLMWFFCSNLPPKKSDLGPFVVFVISDMLFLLKSRALELLCELLFAWLQNK